MFSRNYHKLWTQFGSFQAQSFVKVTAMRMFTVEKSNISDYFLSKNRFNEAQVTSKQVDFYEHAELHLSVVVTFIFDSKNIVEKLEKNVWKYFPFGMSKIVQKTHKAHEKWHEKVLKSNFTPFKLPKMN